MEEHISAKLERCLGKLVHNPRSEGSLSVITGLYWDDDLGRYMFEFHNVKHNRDSKAPVALFLTSEIVWINHDICKEGLLDWDDSPVKLHYKLE